MSINLAVSADTQTENKPSARAYIIWGLATLFYFYDYLLQVSPSAMKPELTEAFAREAEQFGSLAAYYLYAYGLMQIPVGLLIDRFGPRRLITVAALFCALGSFLFGSAETLWIAKVGRILIGVGASFAVVSCLNISATWFPVRRFAFLTGAMVTVGMMGAVFGLSTTSKLVSALGWRETMYFGACTGLLLSVLLWLVVKDKPTLTTVSHQKNVAPTAFRDLMKGLFQIMQQKQNWIGAVYASLMFVPTLAFGGLWGVPFLVEAHGFEREMAGPIISVIFIGFACGGPFYGWLSDYIGRRNLPMMIANFLTLCTCIAIIYLDQLPLPILTALLFGLGFFTSGFILAFAVLRESNPEEASSTAMGFMNAFNTFSGALAQPLIGKVLDMTSTASISGGATVFTLSQYRTALSALPLCLLISLITLFFLKETYCRTYRKHF